MSDQVIITSNVVDGSSTTTNVTDGVIVKSTVNESTTVQGSVTTGAKGDKGDTGATGATGPQGPQGDPATNLVTSVNGHQGVVVLDNTDIGLSNVSNNLQLTVANNLSDLASATDARTNLGLVIGTDVQAYDSNTTILGNSTTGTGAIVRASSPTLTTPNIGTATGSASLNVLKAGDTMTGKLTLGLNNEAMYLGDTTSNSVYMNFNSRGYVGMNASAANMIVQAGASKGILFAVNNNTFASGIIGGFDSTGRLGLLATSNVPTHSLTLGSTATGIALYNTSDQTTNYERVLMQWSSNIFTIASRNGGTGGLRDIGLSVYATNGLNIKGNFTSSGHVQSTLTTGTTSSQVHSVNGTSSASSGVQYGLVVAMTKTQTSTAGYTDLLINSTETTVGSGVKLLMDLQVASTSRFNVDNTGLTRIISTGTLTPATVATYALRVKNAGSQEVVIGTSNNYAYIQSFGSVPITINSQGNNIILGQASGAGLVGIHTVLPTHSLTIANVGTGIALYNTSDQTTNYERVRQYWSGNVFNIFTDQGGTGTARGIVMSALNDSTKALALNTGSTNGFVESRGASSTASAIIHKVGGTLNSTSGTQYGASIAPTIAQTTTAGYTALLINPTETTTGSGAKLLADFQVGGTSKVSIKNDGVFFPVQAVTASAPTYVKGGVYFDTTLSKLRVGGAAGWESITSV